MLYYSVEICVICLDLIAIVNCHLDICQFCSRLHISSLLRLDSKGGLCLVIRLVEAYTEGISVTCNQGESARIHAERLACNVGVLLLLELYHFRVVDLNPEITYIRQFSSGLGTDNFHTFVCTQVDRNLSLRKLGFYQLLVTCRQQEDQQCRNESCSSHLLLVKNLFSFIVIFRVHPAGREPVCKVYTCPCYACMGIVLVFIYIPLLVSLAPCSQILII